jgi:chromosome segregation ATPase
MLERIRPEMENLEREIMRLKAENADLRSQLARSEELRRQEVERVVSELNSVRREYETNLEALRRRIAELEDLLRQYEAEIARVNAEYRRLTEILQSNLNQTITHVITEHKGGLGFSNIRPTSGISPSHSHSVIGGSKYY